MVDYLEFIASTEVEGADTSSNDSGITASDTSVESTNTEVEVTTPTIPEYEIDGEKYTVDQIKEWKQSGLRQSDYTKKTTEVANMRKEAEEALEVYKYLMGKPDLVQKLVELDEDNPMKAKEVKDKLDPVQKELQDIKQQFAMREIETELASITAKDKDVTDVELLELAQTNNCTITQAYKIWRGENFDRILERKMKEKEANIVTELQKNKGVTKTLITEGDKTSDSGSYGLSDQEIAVAKKLGMDLKEYADFKNPNYRG